MKKGTLAFMAFLAAVLWAGNFAPAADAATSRVAVIKEMKGSVLVKKSGGSKEFKAFARMSLNEGDVLSTGANSTAVLQFANGTSEDDKISVSANTTLTFSKLSDRKGTRTKVSMFNGTAWVDVKSIVSKDDEFTLETPTAAMGVRGTHLLVGVDPLTGSTRLTVAAGVVSASVGDGSEPMNVLPNQDAVFTEGDEEVSIAPTDLAVLMAQSDSSIVEAILKAAGDIVKENEEKKDLYVQQSGAQSPEDQARLKSNVENLLGAIVDQAVKSGLISEDRAKALVVESQVQTGAQIDLSKKEITLSDEEKRQQEGQKKKEEDAKKAAEEQQKSEEQERKKNEELLKKLEEERKQKEEANKRAEKEKQEKAAAEYSKQLDDAARQKFEQDQKNRQQEQQSTASPSPAPSATPSPTPTPVTYSVYFHSNGGSNVPGQLVVSNGSAVLPAAPARIGYMFAGWYGDSALTQPFSFSTPITGNTTLYAKWDINSYTVSFLTYGGSAVDSQTIHYNSTITQPVAPKKLGYTFAGWYSDIGLTQEFLFEASPITADTTLYAKWIINTYALGYTAGANGTISGDASQTVNHGANGTPVTAVPNTGYHFDSWDDGVASATRTDLNLTADKNITAYFAINSYTVSFNSNGGSSVTSQSVDYNSKAMAPVIPTRTDYAFAGWYSDSGLTQEFLFDTTPITGDTTLYAKWSINAYTLSYTAGANGTISGDASQTVNHGANGTPVTAVPYTGYHFDSWDDGVTTATRTDTDVTANKSVTANFAINSYTVSFDSNGGSSVTAQSVNYNGTAMAPVDPTRTGYAFAGWYSDSGGTQPFEFTTAITADVTLYARWLPLNAFVNAGFETPDVSGVGDRFVYWPTAPGWTFSGNYAGIERNGSVFGATDAPEGEQAAILQMQGTISQTVVFTAGTYKISFKAASRNENVQSFDLLLDGGIIGSFFTNSPSFTSFSTSPFTVTAGVHTIAFVGKSASDNTSFIDDVQIHVLTAAEIAAGITGITAPAVDATGLTLPSVPSGYAIAIASSSDESVIGTNGVIAPPASATSVDLVLTVTRVSDNTTANTAAITVTVPARALTAAEVAAGITSVTAPVVGMSSLTLPSVPTGYAIAIHSSSNTGIIGTNGAIAPPAVATPVTLVFKVTRISNGSTANTGEFTVTVPPNLPNLALGKVPTTSSSFQDPFKMTNGDKGDWSDGGAGLKWVQIDLGDIYHVDLIKVWHYYDGERSYHDVIVQLSNDPNFSGSVVTVFNNDADNTAGQGWGTDAEYIETSAGKFISFGPINARYVRFWSNGNTKNTSNHYTEIEIYSSTYTVSFNSNGGSSVAGQTVDYNTLATAPDAPTKAGYAFGGWYSDSGLTQPFDFATLITGNTTLYAKWTINSYTVSFDVDDGSDIPSQSVAYNTKSTQPTTAPTKPGHIFAGWYTTASFTTPFDFNTLITVPTTIYAKWIETGPFVNLALYATADASASYPGWDPRAINDGTTSTDWAISGGAAEKWAKLTWNAPQRISHIKLYDRVGIPDRIITGTLTFSDGTSIEVGELPNDGLAPREVIFPAKTVSWVKFTINSFAANPGLAEFEVYDDIYKVNYNSNGGSTIPSQSVIYNGTVSPPSDPALAGYAFGGWYKDSGLTQPFSFTTLITADTTLYAKWNAPYTVTYNANLGGTLTALDRTGWTATAFPTSGDVPANMLDGIAGTRWSTGIPMEAGHYFIVDMLSVKRFNRIVMDTTDSADDYPRGYVVYISDDAISWGGAISGGAGTGAVTTIDLSIENARYLKIVSTANSTGNWSVHELNVFTDGGSGSVPTDSNSYTESATVTVLGNTGILTKPGYVFNGWNTAADGSGTSYAAGATFPMGTSNVTLYAQWAMTS